MLEEAKDQLNVIVKDLYDVDIDIQVSIPEEKFGDLASNVSMQLAKTLNRNPREIAEEISERYRKNEHVISCEIAGPGFLNIRLTDKYLISMVHKSNNKSLDGEKIVVEYSDPNPFKPLHAGHLYTTLVGDVIARLVENAGAKTIRINFGGDVGLHVAKSMWAIVQEVGEDIEKVKSIPKGGIVSWLGKKYVQGTNSYENSEKAKAEIIEINKKVYAVHLNDDHESGFAQIYWLLRDSSYEYFKRLYKELEVKPFDRFIPESEVTKIGMNTVRSHIDDGIYEESDGAVIFDGEKYGLHKRVFINSGGLPTYEAKDVGLSLTKWQDYKFDQSIIITASEIDQYMKVVLKSIEQFEPNLAQKTTHITHGLVKLSGGVKMSSRKGNILSAFDVLEAAKEAGRKSGQATNNDIVLAAIKYGMVKTSLGGDVIFNPEESIATEGNSGPYLQYAHARACSILRKTSFTEDLVIDDNSLDKGERSLARKLAEYQVAVATATNDLAPHIICTYLYELAQEFNRFYEKNKVIAHKRQDIRLSLVAVYTRTLSSGLSLLGTTAPERM